jgi:exonuclease SbcC
VSLDYVSEQASKLAEAALRADVAERDASSSSQRAADLEARLVAAEGRQRQASTVLGTTQNALAIERGAAKEAAERAARAEAALAEARAELARLREEALSSERARGDAASALAMREGELQLLRAQAAAAGAESGAAAARLQAERAAAGEEAQRLQREVEALTSRLSVVLGERDDGAAKLREAHARVAQLLVESGRLSEEASAARGDLTALRTAQTLMEAAALPTRGAGGSGAPGTAAASAAQHRRQFSGGLAPQQQPSGEGSGSGSARAAALLASILPSPHMADGSGALPSSVRPYAFPSTAPATAASAGAAAFQRPAGPVSPASAAARELVRRTLEDAGLDAGEADRWFAAKGAAAAVGGSDAAARGYFDGPAGGSHRHSLRRDASPDERVSAATDGAASTAAGLLSPGAAALQQALERTRQRRQQREASTNGAGTGESVSSPSAVLCGAEAGGAPVLLVC